MRCFQTSPNNDFYTRFRAVLNYRFGVFRFDSTSDAFYSGYRPAEYNTYCLTDTACVDHGTAVSPGHLCGMAFGKDHENFSLSAGVLLVLAAPKDEINKAASTIETLFPGQGEKALDRLSKFNELWVKPDDYSRLHSAVMRRLVDPVEDADGTDFGTLMALLSQVALNADRCLVRPFPDRIHLIRELVEEQMVNNSFVGMTLDGVASSLATSARSLHLSTSESTQNGPMDLLRYIRLEQVRRVLTDKPTREAWVHKTGLKPTAGNVFKHFGMCHQSRAGAAYKELFGVTPKQDQLDHAD